MKVDLHLLRAQIDSAIALQGTMREGFPMEQARYRLEFGQFDCVIGNFGIRQIRDRDDEPERRHISEIFANYGPYTEEQLRNAKLAEKKPRLP